MRIRKKFLSRVILGLFGVSLATLVFTPCASSLGEVCEGTFTYELDRLWDVSGSLDAYFPDLGSDDVGSGRISMDVTQDAKGKITGSGDFDVCSEDACCEGIFTVKGTVKEVAGVLRVSLVIKIRAICSALGEIATFNVTEKVVCEIDEVERTLVGMVSIRGSVCVVGEGCLSLVKLAQYLREEEGIDLPLDQYFEAELEEDMDGTARLEVVLTNVDGKRLIGGAELLLSNGREYDCAVLGKYNSKTDQSMLKLKGDPLTAKGLTFTMILSCESGTALIKGQFAGRKILETLEPIP